jgi:hypothetical protein
MGARGQIDAWLLSLALALGASGCDDGTEETPPPRDGGGGGFTDVDADTEEDASRSDSGRPDGGTPRQEGGEPGGNTSDAGESCEASEAEADEKDWVEGCYKCAPESSEQFLNGCATGWRTFDPENYPNGWQPGDDLPALP